MCNDLKGNAHSAQKKDLRLHFLQSIYFFFFLSKVYLTLRGLASLHEIEMTKRNRFMLMGMAGRHPGGFKLQGTLPWRWPSCTAHGQGPTGRGF